MIVAQVEGAISCYDVPMRPAAILFDLDNTLCDRDAAFGRWLAQISPRLSSCQLSELRRIDDHGRGDRRQLCADLARCSPALGSATSIWDQMRDGIAEHVEVDRYRLEYLLRLRQTYPMAVISNGGSSNQRRKLERIGMANLFGESVFISAETGAAKPELTMFTAAAASLGVRPQQCLMVGDNFEHDIRGAIAAKIMACWVSTNAPRDADERELVQAHNIVVIEAVEQLGEVLQ